MMRETRVRLRERLLGGEQRAWNYGLVSTVAADLGTDHNCACRCAHRVNILLHRFAHRDDPIRFAAHPIFGIHHILRCAHAPAPSCRVFQSVDRREHRNAPSPPQRFGTRETDPALAMNYVGYAKLAFAQPDRMFRYAFRLAQENLKRDV
jgi:hypothetical protein